MAVPKRLRFEILRRDNHTCRYCGGMAPDVALTVDHVVPVALGGTDQPDNLVAACKDCNAGKSSMPADAPLVAQVSQDALRWAAAIKEAAAVAAAATVDRLKRHAAFEELWLGYTYGGPNGDRYTVPLGTGWAQSIDKFLELGLRGEDLADSVYAAMDAGRVLYDEKWRYFCGICWKKISAIQDAARAILAAEGQGGQS